MNRSAQSAASSNLLVTNGRLWGVESREHDAMLVRNGRIASIGRTRDLRLDAERTTEVVDAGGNAVLPGFHDAHVHPYGGGRTLQTCNLATAHDRDSYLTIIADYVAAHTSAGWITGGGWYGDAFDGGLPTAAELDRVTGGRPTFLASHDCHGAWVNSAALELAGIDRDTADPFGGRIVRDARGDATGILMDAAVPLVAELLSPVTFEETVDALRLGLDHLADLGITSIHDALIGAAVGWADPLPAYEAIGADSAPLRVSGSIWWPLGEGLEALESVLERRDRMRAAGFSCDSVKIMQDGICENLTAAMLQPYPAGTGGHDHSGDSSFDPGMLRSIVTELDRRGLRVHFHGVGDRAVRECLDAVASARAANGPGPRHQIAHVDVVHPDDFARFRELDVAANLQPLWARADTEILERKLPLLRHDQVESHFPFGSLVEAGAPLAMGSDWPVSSPNPMWLVHSAVTRTAPTADVHAYNAESRVAMGPRQRLSLERAIDAYTSGSAAAMGRDHELGRLRRGYLADFVVLDGALDDRSSLDGLRVTASSVGGRLRRAL